MMGEDMSPLAPDARSRRRDPEHFTKPGHEQY
jgi:hypothetical protein